MNYQSNFKKSKSKYFNENIIEDQNKFDKSEIKRNLFSNNKEINLIEIQGKNNFKSIDFVPSRYNGENYFFDRSELDPLPETQGKAFLITDVSIFKKKTSKSNISIYSNNSIPKTSQNEEISSLPKHLNLDRSFVNSSKLLNWNKIIIPVLGLINVGNSCFINTVLQCLLFTSPLINLIEMKKDYLIKEDSKFNALRSFFKLFTDYQKSKYPLEPTYFTNYLKPIGKQFISGEMGDAHEFLIELIDKLERSELGEQFLDNKLRSKSIVHQIFGGYFQNTIISQESELISINYEPFIDIQLNLDRTVEDALLKYLSTSKLDENNLYYNSRIKKYEKAIQNISILTCPPILILNFKRNDNNGKKLTKHIEFNDKLNLSPFISNKENSQEMELYAAIIHSGQSSDSGHYYCYIKNPANIWFKIDDEKIQTSNFSKLSKENVQILFYKKILKNEIINENLSNLYEIKKDQIVNYSKNLEINQKIDEYKNKQTLETIQPTPNIVKNKINPKEMNQVKLISKYSQKVESWNPEDKEQYISITNRKRRRESFDNLLDKGKLKKIRKKQEWRTNNPFQKTYEKKKLK